MRIGNQQLRIRMWLVRRGLRCALVVCPLVINVVVWEALVVPQQRWLQDRHNVHRLLALKPRLETLSMNSQRLLTGWLGSPTVDSEGVDATAVIQRLADHHRVHVKEVHSNRSRSAAAKPGGAARGSQTALRTQIDVKATGGFHRLARWLSAIEAQAGLQVESWTMTAGEQPGDDHRLVLELSVPVGGA